MNEIKTMRINQATCFVIDMVIAIHERLHIARSPAKGM